MNQIDSNIMPEIEQRHEQWLKHLHEMSGGIDTRGVEITHTIRMLARLFDQSVSQASICGDLSAPRLGILLRLLAAEHHGNTEGMNPTMLSHYQDVKKNTITSLIQGLEERGLVERSVDPADRRGFLIRITPAGRELVLSTSPNRFEFLNDILFSLSTEEKDQLLVLLNKLRKSLITMAHNSQAKDL